MTIVNRIGSWTNDTNSVHKIILSFLHGISYCYFSEYVVTEKTVEFVVVFLWLNFLIFWNSGHQY